MPKIFSAEEVEILNSNLEKHDDKFILMSNGLLRHHCCYPNCPDYHRCFLTTSDRTNTTTRHGLFSHLKYNVFLNYYVPNLHNNAKLYANNNFDRFKTLMDMTYKEDVRYTSLGDDVRGEVLKNCWETYRCNYAHNN